MRAAYVCADGGVPVFGTKGSSVHVQEVVRALLGEGVEVELLAPRVGGDPPPGLANVPVHALPTPRAGDDAAGRERAALQANDALRDALSRLRPVDFVYERYSLWSFAGMETARAVGVPGVLEVNARLVEEQARYRALHDPAAAARVARRAFAAASAVVAVSEEVADWVLQEPAARGRVHVVRNGVDPARFPPGAAPSRPAPAGTFTVGFVGSMRPWHGLPILVEAFDLLRRRTPHCRLLVVGGGPERGAVEADVARRGLRDVVHLSGAVPPAEVPGLLASMDAAVAPYPAPPPGETFYFSPLKLFEYMAAGLPVVGTAVGSVARVIRDGYNGLLVPGVESRELAGHIAAALGRLADDAPLRARLGAAARQIVLRDHTWKSVARTILGLVAGTRAPSGGPGSRSAGGAVMNV